MNVSGVLYVCATPIGNLEDITLRVLRILKEVDLVAAEDTRHTRKLLNHYSISTPLTSFHEHNKIQKTPELLALLQGGRAIALVSDAGTPGISDPGLELIQAAIGARVPVVPLPGPSAALTALVVSGLPAGRFVFEGFLPRGKKKRQETLQSLVGEARTMIFYEAPHRLLATLADLQEIFGARPLAVARELTKQYEEVFRGTAGEALARFHKAPPRGEFCLVVAGKESREGQDGQDGRDSGGSRDKDWEHLTVEEHVADLVAKGSSRKEAVKEVARLRGLPKNQVYQAAIEGGNRRSQGSVRGV
ncbi:MAG: 16S rRNA (cytidine(1402)-2'-O)-methyltransferase [Syntrophothermus sp.]